MYEGCRRETFVIQSFDYIIVMFHGSSFGRPLVSKPSKLQSRIDVRSDAKLLWYSHLIKWVCDTLIWVIIHSKALWSWARYGSWYQLHAWPTRSKPSKLQSRNKTNKIYIYKVCYFVPMQYVHRDIRHIDISIYNVYQYIMDILVYYLRLFTILFTIKKDQNHKDHILVFLLRNNQIVINI